MGGGERFGGQVPQPGVPAKSPDFVGWEMQGGAEDRRERILRMRDRGPEKLPWGPPLAGNGAPQMGCMGGEDPPIGYWHRL